MQPRNVHASSVVDRRRPGARRWLSLVVVIASAPFAAGSACIDLFLGGGDEERQRCEEVCAAEGQCSSEGARSEADCLAKLCTDDGFANDGDGTSLSALSSNDCIREAATCADVFLCTCADGCARVAECTGDGSDTCEADCEALVEQAPADVYQENRCKAEASCADLPACG